MAFSSAAVSICPTVTALRFVPSSSCRVARLPRSSISGFLQVLVCLGEVLLRLVEPNRRGLDSFAEVFLRIAIVFQAHEYQAHFVESMRRVHDIEQTIE